MIITNIYNRTAEILLAVADNGVARQGGLNSKRAIYYARSVANNNHSAPVPTSEKAAPAPSTSFCKSLDRENDDNPITQEALSDGLGALFGAATGLEGIELLVDYACDAAELYDEFMLDRYGRYVPVPETPAPQPDPRLWMQPQPGMGMAA